MEEYLIKEYPYFYILLSHCDIYFIDEVGRALTIEDKILINRQWWNTLSFEQQVQVITHELLHLAQNHGIRFTKLGEDNSWIGTWNVACDIWISYIQELNGLWAGIDNTVYYGHYDLEDNIYYLSVEEIFRKLKKTFGKIQGDYLNTIDFSDKTAKATLLQKASGKNLLLGSSLDWKTIIRNKIYRAHTVERRTYSRINRRFLEHDLIIRGYEREDSKKVVLVVDISQSMFKTLLGGKELDYIRKICEEIGIEIRIIFHNERVLEKPIFRDGITLFQPVLDYLEVHFKDCPVFWYTDGDYNDKELTFYTDEITWLLTKNTSSKPLKGQKLWLTS